MATAICHECAHQSGDLHLVSLSKDYRDRRGYVLRPSMCILQQLAAQRGGRNNGFITGYSMHVLQTTLFEALSFQTYTRQLKQTDGKA